jgi:uncharacterized Zn-binding protein involved in type VI secretion
MPAVTRLGDLCTGHGNFPPRPSITASPKVLASGKGVVRVGDAYAIHCSGSCHPGTATVGSPKVFASGQPKMRVGDTINCGSKVAQGSSKVFIG